MNKKTLLTLAIIALLPITAHADYVYNEVDHPTPVSYNGGTVTMASSTGPYRIATIDDNDDEHIASTAYVKGAYNDAIAAINTKQRSLYYNDPDTGNRLPIAPYVAMSLDDVQDNEQLISAGAVDDAIADINTTISNQRVEIYTTWDDDTAKTEVAFVTAQ